MKCVAVSADGEMPLSEFMVPTPSSACHVPTRSCMLIFRLFFSKRGENEIYRQNIFLPSFIVQMGFVFKISSYTLKFTFLSISLLS